MFSVGVFGEVSSAFELAGETYGVSGAVIVKAILHTIATENIVHEILAGVHVEEFARPRGRPKGPITPSKPKSPKPHRYFLNGLPVKLEAVAMETGIPRSTIQRRVKMGMSMDQAISFKDARRK